MKRMYVPLALAATLVAAACGKPKVVVRAQLDGGPVADLPVRLLSYDRKAILDSLARSSKTPEPVFPQELIQQIRQLDAELPAARARGDTAVARVDAQRRALTARTDTIRALRQAWATRAFARFDTIVQKKTVQRGLVIREDTTDAAGRAELKGDKGQWWISARYTLRYTELSWDIPVKVEPGQDSVVVTLTRANAVETASF
ncbi:MAG: hypothetical protein JWM27_927 [Gemmatimonadetes bacterium]|nr:hypothetical protein [Gemmatimonadota bacterium]